MVRTREIALCVKSVCAHDPQVVAMTAMVNKAMMGGELKLFRCHTRFSRFHKNRHQG
jgi:hypothetical protein